MGGVLPNRAWIMPVIVLCVCIVGEPYSFAQESPSQAELLKKIESIQSQINELESMQDDRYTSRFEHSSSVRSFLNDRLHFGGFFETGMTHLSGPDTSSQVVAGSHTLGINLSAEFSSRWRFVAQYVTYLMFPIENQHNNPDAETLSLPAERTVSTLLTGSVLTQAYLEGGASDFLKVQTGLGYTPFGQAFQQRELVLFKRRGGAQALRTEDLLEPLWSGLHILGSDLIHQSRWGYHVYTVTPLKQARHLGGGTRFWWSTLDQRLNAGVSTQIKKYGADTHRVVGIDLSVKERPFSLTTEFYYCFAEGDDPWSFYIEPAMQVYQDFLLLYVFADYAKSPLNQIQVGKAVLADPYERLEYGMGLNWLPTVFTRLRLGVFMFNYIGDTATVRGQDRDLLAFDLSAGVAF